MRKHDRSISKDSEITSGAIIKMAVKIGVPIVVAALLFVCLWRFIAFGSFSLL